MTGARQPSTAADRRKRVSNKTTLVRVLIRDLPRIDAQRLAEREPRADVIHRILDAAGLPGGERSS
jgi:hypothetical protein